MLALEIGFTSIIDGLHTLEYEILDGIGLIRLQYEMWDVDIDVFEWTVIINTALISSRQGLVNEKLVLKWERKSKCSMNIYDP